MLDPTMDLALGRTGVLEVKQSTGLFVGIESRRAFSPAHLVLTP